MVRMSFSRFRFLFEYCVTWHTLHLLTYYAGACCVHRCRRHVITTTMTMATISSSSTTMASSTWRTMTSQRRLQATTTTTCSYSETTTTTTTTNQRRSRTSHVTQCDAGPSTRQLVASELDCPERRKSAQDASHVTQHVTHHHVTRRCRLSTRWVEMNCRARQRLVSGFALCPALLIICSV